MIKRIVLISLTFALIACTPTPTPKAELPPLRITHSLWPGDYPIILAQALGLFEKHNVSVEIVQLENYSDLMPTFLSGQSDICLPNWPEAITMNDRKPGFFKVILAHDYSDGADQIVSLPEIKSIADLDGKRIGVIPRTYGDLFVRQMLAQAGMTADNVTIVALGPEEVVTNIPDRIDAGYTWEPYTSEARQRGLNIIFDSRSTPGLLTDVMIVRTDIVQNRPEDLDALIDIWFEALAYWQSNPEDAATLIAGATSQKPEEISLEGIHMYSREENAQAFDPESGSLSLFTTGETIVSFLKSVGLLTAKPNFNTLLEPRFIK